MKVQQVKTPSLRSRISIFNKGKKISRINFQLDTGQPKLYKITTISSSFQLIIQYNIPAYASPHPRTFTA
jgi:hypothetical protein